MTRETKLGLVVSGSFCCLLGALVAHKLLRPEDTPNKSNQQQQTAKAAPSGKGQPTSKKKQSQIQPVSAVGKIKGGPAPLPPLGGAPIAPPAMPPAAPNIGQGGIPTAPVPPISAEKGTGQLISVPTLPPGSQLPAVATPQQPTNPTPPLPQIPLTDDERRIEAILQQKKDLVNPPPIPQPTEPIVPPAPQSGSGLPTIPPTAGNQSFGNPVQLVQGKKKPLPPVPTVPPPPTIPNKKAPVSPLPTPAAGAGKNDKTPLIPPPDINNLLTGQPRKPAPIGNPLPPGAPTGAKPGETIKMPLVPPTVPPATQGKGGSPIPPAPPVSPPTTKKQPNPPVAPPIPPNPPSKVTPPKVVPTPPNKGELIKIGPVTPDKGGLPTKIPGPSVGPSDKGGPGPIPPPNFDKKRPGVGAKPGALINPIKPATPKIETKVDPRTGIKNTDYRVDSVRLSPNMLTFDAISHHYYDSSKYAPALQKFNQERNLLNKNLNGNNVRLQPGDVVLIPPTRILRDLYPNELRDVKPLPAIPPIRIGMGPRANVNQQLPKTKLPPMRVNNTQPKNKSLWQKSAKTNAGTAPMGGNGGEYVVQREGEMFYQIARDTMGDGRQWPNIWRLNQHLRPQEPIPVGTRLRLPVTARANP